MKIFVILALGLLAAACAKHNNLVVKDDCYKLADTQIICHDGEFKTASFSDKLQKDTNKIKKNLHKTWQIWED